MSAWDMDPNEQAEIRGEPRKDPSGQRLEHLEGAISSMVEEREQRTEQMKQWVEELHRESEEARARNGVGSGSADAGAIQSLQKTNENLKQQCDELRKSVRALERRMADRTARAEELERTLDDRAGIEAELKAKFEEQCQRTESLERALHSAQIEAKDLAQAHSDMESKLYENRVQGDVKLQCLEAAHKDVVTNLEQKIADLSNDLLELGTLSQQQALRIQELEGEELGEADPVEQASTADTEGPRDPSPERDPSPDDSPANWPAEPPAPGVQAPPAAEEILPSEPLSPSENVGNSVVAELQAALAAKDVEIAQLQEQLQAQSSTAATAIAPPDQVTKVSENSEDPQITNKDQQISNLEEALQDLRGQLARKTKEQSDLDIQYRLELAANVNEELQARIELRDKRIEGLEVLLGKRDSTNTELEALLEQAQFTDPPSKEPVEDEVEMPNEPEPLTQSKTLGKGASRGASLTGATFSNNPVIARRIKDLENRIQVREQRMGQMKRNFDRKIRWVEEKMAEIERQRAELLANQDGTLIRNEELHERNDWLEERFDQNEMRMKTYELSIKDLKQELKERNQDFFKVQRQMADLFQKNSEQEKKLEEYEHFNGVDNSARALVNVDLHHRADKLEDDKRHLLKRIRELESRAPLTKQLMEKGFLRQMQRQLNLDANGKIRMTPDRFGARAQWRAPGVNIDEREIIDVEIQELS